MQKASTVLKSIIVSVLALIIVGTFVYAAPSFRLERSVHPETDSTYELGTSTLQWLYGWFDNLRVTDSTTTNATTTNLYLVGQTDGCLEINGELVSSTGSACGTGSGGSGSEWEYVGDNLQNKTATTSDVRVVGSFQASSTALFNDVSMLNATATNLTVTSLSDTFVAADSTGKLVATTTPLFASAFQGLWDSAFNSTTTWAHFQTNFDDALNASSTIARSDDLHEPVSLDTTNFDYLSLVGQEITLEAINWADISDVPTSTTDQLPEGATNLYYTDSRVGDYVDASTTLPTTNYIWDFSDNINATAGANIEFNGDEIAVIDSPTFQGLTVLGTITTTNATSTSVMVGGNSTTTGYFSTLPFGQSAPSGFGFANGDVNVFNNLYVGGETSLGDDLTFPNANSNLFGLGNLNFQTGATGGTIRTGESNADKWALAAYDVNDATHRVVASAHAGNDVLFHLFTDSLRVTDSTDDTKRVDWDLSGLTTGNTRTLTVQDSDGTLAYTSDLHDEVTLAGTPDYITIAGQVITRALIDLANDVTGILGIANGGTGISDTPEFGEVLVGNSSGGYTLTATSSLGISGGSTDSPWEYTFEGNLTPTSTNAGLFVNASSTFNNNLRVNGNTTSTGNLFAPFGSFIGNTTYDVGVSFGTFNVLGFFDLPALQFFNTNPLGVSTQLGAVRKGLGILEGSQNGSEVDLPQISFLSRDFSATGDITFTTTTDTLTVEDFSGGVVFTDDVTVTDNLTVTDLATFNNGATVNTSLLTVNNDAQINRQRTGTTTFSGNELFYLDAYERNPGFKIDGGGGLPFSQAAQFNFRASSSTGAIGNYAFAAFYYPELNASSAVQSGAFTVNIEDPEKSNAPLLALNAQTDFGTTSQEVGGGLFRNLTSASSTFAMRGFVSGDLGGNDDSRGFDVNMIGTGGDDNFGARFSNAMNGGVTNYALYTNAENGATDYAGYFDGGEVYIQNTTSNPFAYTNDITALTPLDLQVGSDGSFGIVPSSQRYKENIEDASADDTDWLLDLDVRRYDRKDGSRNGEQGLIAEEVAAINPHIVAQGLKRIEGECVEKVDTFVVDGVTHTKPYQECEPDTFERNGIIEAINYSDPTVIASLIDQVQRQAEGLPVRSSERYKDNLSVYSGQPSTLAKLDVLEFTYLDSDEKHIGLSAEQVAEHFPDIVEYVDDKPSRIKFSDLVSLLLGWVQEIAITVTGLEEKVTEQEQKIEQLEQRLEKLESAKVYTPQLFYSPFN